MSVDVSYGERGRDRDPAKGKMCKHQTTDVLKILSGRIYGGGTFRVLEQVKYKMEIKKDF